LPRKTDEFPSNEIFVTAVIRLAKHAFHNVTAHKLEKLRSVFYRA
jgi:hypothetical protein